VLLIVLGLLSPLGKAQQLFLNIDGLLPSKSDDKNAYPILQEPRWYFGTSWSENLSEPGFIEGRAVEYYQRFYAHSDMSVEFYVYLFHNISDAEGYYNRQIDDIKLKGQYSEVSIPDVFAVVYDYDTQEIGISWGLIRNIVFKVAVYTANIVEDPTNQLMNFTELEYSRIFAVGLPSEPSSNIYPSATPTPTLSTATQPSSTVTALPSLSPAPEPQSSEIPELSSLIILPLLMVATLVSVMFLEKKGRINR
jgi:hypothetical protein